MAEDSNGLTINDETREVELDVRDILRRKEEPFQKIMTTVETLKEGYNLKLVTTFEPKPLITVLGKKGLIGTTTQLGEDHYVTVFRRE